MNIVFFGTPDYVVPILDVLQKAFKKGSKESPIKAVVTRPPKPSGRKQEITYSAVDLWTQRKNKKIKNEKEKIRIYYDPKEIVSKNVEADVAVLAAYGAIVPKQVLDHFPHGILNVHPSILPKLRGASPVQAIIATGGEVGVSVIKLDEKMDHGPILTQFRDRLKDNDTTETLRSRLFEKSAEVLKTLIQDYVHGKIKLKPQDHSKATFTTLLKKDHGFIPWKNLEAAMQGKRLTRSDLVIWKIPFIKDYSTHYSPKTIHDFIRALSPWPGVWTLIKIQGQEKRLKILKTHLKNKQLFLDEVQVEGKNPVSWTHLQTLRKLYSN